MPRFDDSPPGLLFNQYIGLKLYCENRGTSASINVIWQCLLRCKSSVSTL